MSMPPDQIAMAKKLIEQIKALTKDDIPEYIKINRKLNTIINDNVKPGIIKSMNNGGENKNKKLPKSNMTKKMMDELNDTKPDGGITKKAHVMVRCNKLQRPALMMMLKHGFGLDAKGNKEELVKTLATKIPMKVDEMEKTLANMPPEVIDNTLNGFGVEPKASWNKTHKGQRLAQQFYAASDYGSDSDDEDEEHKKPKKKAVIGKHKPVKKQEVCKDGS